MVTRPRNKTTGGSWSDSRIDSSKPFNLKFYPNATTIDRWTEVSFGSRGKTIDMKKNSFSVEEMCYLQGKGGRCYKGCYYPAVDGSYCGGIFGKDAQKNYGRPTLIYTLQNNKGENVGYTNTTYHKSDLPTTFWAFNPQSISFSGIIDRIDENKLGNDGKVYGKAFVALFPALPPVPQVHHSVYEKFSAESISQKFFTEYNEAEYLSQQEGRLASNTVNFQIQVRMPTPTITVKKKRVKVIM
tara:strand:- start:5 stop:730 length:726 start_codon:yes stop_codon:yes gene_type:complete